MKKLLFAIAFAALCTNAAAQKSFLLAGAGSESIVIVDKATKAVTPKIEGLDSQCNSVAYTPEGHIAYAYGGGARLVDVGGAGIIFDFKAGEGEIIHSISAIKDGFLLGIAGSPIRIVEVNKKGEVTKEQSFDSGVANNKKQFRQIQKTANGTYVIPIAEQKRVVEINAQGRMLKNVELEYSPLYVTINSSGNWFVTCGHSGYVYEIDGESAEIYTIISDPNLGGGVKIEFAAGIVELKNGNYLMANWTGHNGDQSQPILIEFDSSGAVVSTFAKPEGITFVSAVCPIY